MNERGSVSLFLMLAVLGAIFAFTLFLKDSLMAQGENTALHLAKNAARNIEASYEYDLYDQYGLLAYTKDALEKELQASTVNHMPEAFGLAFQNRVEYKFDYTVLGTFESVENAANQMFQQAEYNVPVAFITSLEGYKDIINKLGAAKSKIQSLEGLMDKLEKIGDINTKLGKAMKEIKEFDEAYSVYVSSRGKLSLKYGDITKARKKLLDSIGDISALKAELDESLEHEKQELEANTTVYPDGFSNSLSQQLDSIVQESANVLSLELTLSGINLSSSAQSKAKQKLENLALDRLVSGSTYSKYLDVLAGLYAIEDDLEDLEDKYKRDYKSELATIKNLERRERRSVRRDIEERIKEKVDHKLEDIELRITDLSPAFSDDALEEGVDTLLDYELGAYNGATLKGNKVNDPLSKGKIDSQQWQTLPSQNFQAGERDYTLAERCLLTEYIMGTFNHRNIQHQDPAWSFYNMKDREAFFGNGEIEYIIAGGRSEATNRKIVAGEIYLIREAINILHVYTCKEKLKYAGEVSALVSAQPYLKPVIFNGILIGWASVESAVDLNYLLEGEDIPFMKFRETDWFTSIQVKGNSNMTKEPPKKIESTNDKSKKNKPVNKVRSQMYEKILNTNQKDYAFHLRLLLYIGSIRGKTSSVETKVARALDIIVLNSGVEGEAYELNNLITSHRATIQWEGGSNEYETSY